MALARTHRQVVYRLLPQTRSNWRWLETVLESRRQPCNAALEERIDRCRKTGRSLTCFDQCKGLTECRRDLPEMASVQVTCRRCNGRFGIEFQVTGLRRRRTRRTVQVQGAPLPAHVPRSR